MNRSMKIIFTLSLLLNVLLIGVVGGAAYKRWQGAPHAAHRAAQDPAFSHKMGRAMAESRKGQEGLFREMRAARKEMYEVLGADTFDEAAFMAASDKMRKVQAQMFDARNDVTLKMAREMSAAERKELAAHLKAMGERFGRKREGAKAGAAAPPAKEGAALLR